MGGGCDAGRCCGFLTRACREDTFRWYSFWLSALLVEEGRKTVADFFMRCNFDDGNREVLLCKEDLGNEVIFAGLEGDAQRSTFPLGGEALDGKGLDFVSIVRAAGISKVGLTVVVVLESDGQ